MKWLSTIAHADEGEIRIEKMALDENGRPFRQRVNLRP